jgi:hypothetical protein
MNRQSLLERVARMGTRDLRQTQDTRRSVQEPRENVRRPAPRAEALSCATLRRLWPSTTPNREGLQYARVSPLGSGWSRMPESSRTNPAPHGPPYHHDRRASLRCVAAFRALNHLVSWPCIRGSGLRFCGLTWRNHDYAESQNRRPDPDPQFDFGLVATIRICFSSSDFGLSSAFPAGKLLKLSV